MNQSILFVLQRPLKDIKANLIQTMNMCLGMALNKQKVSLLLPIEISEAEADSILDSILSNYSNYFEVTFIPYKPKFKIADEFDRFFCLRKHIEFSSDFVFTRSPLITIYCALKGQKVIYESHNSYFAKQKHLNLLYTFIFRRIAKRESFSLFVTISENLNKFWIKNGIQSGKTIGLHDGTSVPKSLDNVKIPYENEKLLVTYTGSLYEDRGIERIIELAKNFTELNFLVVGGPKGNADSYRKSCESDNIANIRFIGPVEHNKVASYLSKSDILLALWSSKVPTIDYCSPLKVFEYMASNKLIVADGFITIKEVLSHNENAVLVEPDDYNSLEIAFKKIMENKDHYLNLGKNNIDLIHSCYSWENRSNKILNKLNEIQ